MKTSKPEKTELGSNLLLKEHYTELQEELKCILEKIGSLNKFVIEERDLNKIAKTISNRINEVSALISSTAFTAKSFYETTLSSIEQFTSIASQLDKSLTKLKLENKELIDKTLKPETCDMSVNTDEKLLSNPAHLVALQKMEERLEIRETELNSRIQVLSNDRKQLKNRVIEQYSTIQTLKMEVQDLERKRRADKVLIEELEADTSLQIPRSQYSSARNIIYNRINTDRQVYAGNDATLQDDEEESGEYLVSSADVDRFLTKLSKNENSRHLSGSARNANDRDRSVAVSHQRSTGAAANRYSHYEPGNSDEDTSPLAPASDRGLVGGRSLIEDQDEKSIEDSLAYSDAGSSLNSSNITRHSVSPAVPTVPSFRGAVSTTSTSGSGAVGVFHNTLVDPYPEEDYYDSLLIPPPPPPVMDPPPVFGSGSTFSSSSSGGGRSSGATLISGAGRSSSSHVSRIPVYSGGSNSINSGSGSGSSSRPPLAGRPISQEEDRRRKKILSREIDQSAAAETEGPDRTLSTDRTATAADADESSHHDLSGEIYDYVEEVTEEEYAEEQDEGSGLGRSYELGGSGGMEGYHPHKAVYEFEGEVEDLAAESESEEEEEDAFDGEWNYPTNNNEGNTSSESNPLAVSADDSITMIHKYF